MAIIIAIASFVTISTFYFFHKRKNVEKTYGVVLKKAGKNVVHIGYQGERYLVYASDQRYARLEIGSQIAIKPIYTPDGMTIVLD